ncbi:tRNA preQ1(34) S-adenosylmethionine ribosyltransferase-isomerase QueA [Patescibacteria group bacterium]
MQTKDFNYNLPKELIAKNPVSPRDSSKLMVLNRDSQSINNKIFNELPEILNDDYVLVLNDTKVIAARLYVQIDDSKGELLLLKRYKENVWKTMVKPGKKFQINKGFKVIGKKEKISAKVLEVFEDGTRKIEFMDVKSLSNWIDDNGYPPFPPYIKNSDASFEDYQTIYSKDSGSIAAPTAGLHFTDSVFENLNKKGIKKTFVTLHVSRGTFLPVKSDNIEDHKMHKEWYSISEQTAEFLNQAKSSGKKILAVGTTAVRTLESNFSNGRFHEQCNETDIFIYPGYKFKAIDAILTNFHLPESTLLMLISAFASKEFIFEAYKEAITKKYRFYSFGDSMLIL